VTLKVVPKAACDPEKLFQKLLARMYIGEIQPMRAKARWNRTLVWLLEQFLESASVFRDARRDIKFFFVLNKAA
jgi:hypothetical protein